MGGPRGRGNEFLHQGMGDMGEAAELSLGARETSNRAADKTPRQRLHVDCRYRFISGGVSRSLKHQ
jgi:hypothetical protein